MKYNKNFFYILDFQNLNNNYFSFKNFIFKLELLTFLISWNILFFLFNYFLHFIFNIKCLYFTFLYFVLLEALSLLLIFLLLNLFSFLFEIIDLL